METIKYFDMFSGIGGFRLAFDRAGFKSVGFCEIDPHVRNLYKAYFDTEGEFECYDATKIDPQQLPDFDILVGGFPCQAFSIAGKRQGFDDTRGTLFFDIVRILTHKKPRYILLENVKGLLNHNGGKTFSTITQILTHLGYRVEWQVLNSKYFCIPQHRERVFIVGCLRDLRPGKIFPITRIDTENINKIRDGKLSIDPKLCFINKPRFDQYKTSDIVQTLKVAGDIPLMRVRNGTKKGYDEAKIGDGINLAYPKNAARRGRVGKQVSQTLDTHCQMGTIAGDESTGYRIRRLTPLECFRLQGFPDDMVEKAREIKLCDNRLYKMAGNAVTVNVVEAIARKIMAEIQDQKNV